MSHCKSFLISLVSALVLCSATGAVHAHAVVGPREMLAYAGHVHAARVGVVLEAFVTALPGRLERHPLPGQPFLGLFLPGEEPPAEDAAPR